MKSTYVSHISHEPIFLKRKAIGVVDSLLCIFILLVWGVGRSSFLLKLRIVINRYL